MKWHKLRLRIGGIDCPGCATDVETVLAQLEGIIRVNVDYAGELIAVEYDPDLIDERVIASSIRSMGFTPEGF